MISIGRNQKANSTIPENKPIPKNAHKAHTDLVLQLDVKEEKDPSHFDNDVLARDYIERCKTSGSQDCAF